MQPSRTPRVRIILDAATRLFAAEGFDAVSVAAIAELAGICKANVFHHFSCKEDLYVQVMKEASSAHADYAERLRHTAESSAAKVRKLIEFDIHHMLENRERTRLVFREVADGGNGRVRSLVRAVFQRNFSAVVGIFQQGRDIGEFRESINPAAAAMLLCGATKYFFDCRETLREFDETGGLESPAVYAEHAAGLILGGLAR